MATLQNGIRIETRDYDFDFCPVHGGESKKEYDFGMEDATVIVYGGCQCAICIDKSAGFGDTGSYHTSYQSAAGVARLIVAGEDAFAHKHGM